MNETSKKNLLFAAAVVAAAVIGAASAMLFKSSEKVAVVNVDLVASSAPEVRVLGEQRRSELASLQQFVKEANENLEKLTGKKKTEQEEKYKTELLQKQEEIRNQDTVRLQAIEKRLNNAINEVADKGGYTMVVSKAAIVRGGTDITNEVIQKLQK